MSLCILNRDEGNGPSEESASGRKLAHSSIFAFDTSIPLRLAWKQCDGSALFCNDLDDAFIFDIFALYLLTVMAATILRSVL